jgi:excisionase family DNA binding protein
MNSLKNRIPEAKQDSNVSALPQLLTVAEAARYIGVSRSYLDKGRCEGALHSRTPGPRYTKIGGSVRYPLAELNKWLSELPMLASAAEEAKR